MTFMSPRGQRGGGGTGAKERVERKEREGTEGEGENKDGMAVVRKGSSRLGSVAEARREPRREWTQFSRLARQTQVNSATRFLAHSPEQNQPCHQTNPSAPQTRLDALPLSEGPPPAASAHPLTPRGPLRPKCTQERQRRPSHHSRPASRALAARADGVHPAPRR